MADTDGKSNVNIARFVQGVYGTDFSGLPEHGMEKLRESGQGRFLDDAFGTKPLMQAFLSST